ncbi:hypothetical protein [Fundidesulfovibrio terrae]|uniref:hypothetical protein n=1 Tax=Fundidesulfovibrio terrae TaxID=2922866 RepID=UPI001FAEC435|nr:hypothetical protein [Fundidesulfovibrio terrae]
MECDSGNGTPGRPRKNRALHAGDKLRMAFMLLQKSWGSNTNVPGHIFNMKRWEFCGLPKSIKTVKEDIRCGVAYDRLVRYASLLNIPPALLADDSVRHADPDFVTAIVKGKSDGVPPSIMLQNIFGTTVNEKFLDFNRPEYVGELFDLIKGFYIVYLMKFPLDVGINKMALAIYDTDVYCLRMKANFFLETEQNSMDGEMHRWGSFLYANFYLNEMHSFAMAMLPEPLRNPVIVGRKPFYMTGKYLFGSEAFSREPLFAVFHMERHEPLPEVDWEDSFEAFCRENISYQFLFSGEPEYDYAMVRLRSAGEGIWNAKSG